MPLRQYEVAHATASSNKTWARAEMRHTNKDKPACLLACLPACLLACLAAWLLGCLAAWLLGCLAAWLPKRNAIWACLGSQHASQPYAPSAISPFWAQPLRPLLRTPAFQTHSAKPAPAGSCPQSKGAERLARRAFSQYFKGGQGFAF